jgi:hypothetical protein
MIKMKKDLRTSHCSNNYPPVLFILLIYNREELENGFTLKHLYIGPPFLPPSFFPPSLYFSSLPLPPNLPPSSPPSFLPPFFTSFLFWCWGLNLGPHASSTTELSCTPSTIGLIYSNSGV